MKIIIVALSVMVPLIMYILQINRPRLRKLYHILALIALVVFGNIASLKIYDVIIDNTVYSFEIHSIFLNPLFIITGAYLGVYAIYLLLLISVTNDL